MIPVSHIAAVGVALKANQDNAKRIMQNSHKLSTAKQSSTIHKVTNSEPDNSNMNTNTPAWNDAINVSKEATEMLKNLTKILGVNIDD